jgi:hypothetical protein
MFICGLLNGAVSKTGNMASKDWMLVKDELEKVNGRARGLI